MSSADFVGLYNKYRLTNFIGVDDWADQLSYSYSFVIVLACTVLVTSKTYFLRPIACHMPTAPTGANFKHYVEAACWVLGTIPIRMNESIPQKPDDWEKIEESRRINYYQWVPFMLGLQCIMFYLPCLAWKSISFNRLGTDLNQLIAKATEALTAKNDRKREECVEQAARSLELLLFAHRDYRHGVLSSCKRSMSRLIGFLFVSKRLGTWTLFSYFCVKLTYLANTLLQLYLMMLFLNYDQNMFHFAFKLLGNLLSKTDWTESLYFPRLAYCPLRLRHLGARENFYAGVCALPINMFNEKIYIFLFFWVMLVMICTAISLVVWIVRMSTRRRRGALIRKYLRLKLPALYDQTGTPRQSSKMSSENLDVYRKSLDPTNQKNIDAFVHKFLRMDGVFLIHVMTANAGDVVTADIVALLWHAWATRYAGLSEWEHPSDDSDSDYEPPPAPLLEEIRTLTESTLSDFGTLSGDSAGLRRRQYEMQAAHPRQSIPRSYVKRTC